MLAPVVRGSDTFQTGDGSFKTGKRSRMGEMDGMRFRKSRRTNSVTKAKTNPHITYNENLVTSGEFVNYVANSYQHFLIGIKNHYDNGQAANNEQRAYIMNALHSLGSNYEHMFSVPLDDNNMMKIGNSGPVIGLKLPIANMCLAATQNKLEFANLSDVHSVAKDLYMMGICINTPTEQAMNIQNETYVVPIYKGGHTECFAMWNRVEEGRIVQPKIGTPLFFILKPVRVADYVQGAKWAENVANQPNTFRLKYHVGVQEPTKKITYRHQVIWEIHPWFRMPHSVTDAPDIDVDCSLQHNGRTYRGGYWFVGYVWQMCFPPLKETTDPTDYVHSVRDIELGNTCIIRACTKQSAFMS